MKEKDEKRFRSLASEHSFETGESRRSLRMEQSISGDPKFLDTCTIKQSGETVARAEDNYRACEQALDQLEMLVRE